MMLFIAAALTPFLPSSTTSVVLPLLTINLVVTIRVYSVRQLDLTISYIRIYRARTLGHVKTGKHTTIRSV